MRPKTTIQGGSTAIAVLIVVGVLVWIVTEQVECEQRCGGDGELVRGLFGFACICGQRGTGQ